jgi:hypothetical protein
MKILINARLVSPLCVAEDCTTPVGPFCISNRWMYFRGPRSSPGSQGQYADVHFHAGLVCINGPEGMNAKTEAELFGIVLELIGEKQMLNEILEMTLSTTRINTNLYDTRCRNRSDYQ